VDVVALVLCWDCDEPLSKVATARVSASQRGSRIRVPALRQVELSRWPRSGTSISNWQGVFYRRRVVRERERGRDRLMMGTTYLGVREDSVNVVV
jgi:hypothetical protein